MREINKDTSLSDAGLSVRTRNLLYQNASEFGIEIRFGEIDWDFTLGALEGYPLSKLKGLRGFGVATLQETRKMLQRAGVELNMENFKEEPVQRNIIYFNRFTKEGRVLFELARLLQKQDSKIVIQ